MKQNGFSCGRDTNHDGNKLGKLGNKSPPSIQFWHIHSLTYTQYGRESSNDWVLNNRLGCLLGINVFVLRQWVVGVTKSGWINIEQNEMMMTRQTRETNCGRSSFYQCKLDPFRVVPVIWLPPHYQTPLIVTVLLPPSLLCPCRLTLNELPLITRSGLIDMQTSCLLPPSMGSRNVLIQLPN